MSLKDFLEQRSREPAQGESVHAAIAGYKAAETALVERLVDRLKPYPQLELEKTGAGLMEQAIFYNVLELVIGFRDAQIAVEPRGALLPDSRGRVAMACGAKLVLLDWQGGEDWTYWWSSPERGEPRKPLTDEAIDTIVEELLA
jgi:hypothetical protein